MELGHVGLSLPATLVLRSEEEFAIGRLVAVKQAGIQADGSQPCLQAVTPKQSALAALGAPCSELASPTAVGANPSPWRSPEP